MSTTYAPVSSPIRYFGGKSRLARKIVSLFPEHGVFVDVFGGGGSITLAKPPAALDVYNDLNGHLTNFFWVLSQKKLFDKFRDMVSVLPYSRVLYDRARKTIDGTRDPVLRAALWFVIHRACFAGRTDNTMSFSLTGDTSCVAAWLSSIRRLPDVHSRLQSVQIDSRDFRRVIESYDSGQTLFYLDPPYVPDSRKSGEYTHEMTEQDHRDLVELLLRIKGQAVLSGYDTPVYRPLIEGGWQLTRVPVKLSAAKQKQKQKQKRVECLWTSFRNRGISPKC